MTCYNDMAARNHAAEEGRLQLEQDYRENMCYQYLIDQLADIKKEATAATSEVEKDMTIWHRFSERQDYSEAIHYELCTLLAWIANADGDTLENLQTLSSDLSMATFKIQDDLHNMLLEEAAGHIDGGGEL